MKSTTHASNKYTSIGPVSSIEGGSSQKRYSAYAADRNFQQVSAFNRGGLGSSGVGGGLQAPPGNNNVIKKTVYTLHGRALDGTDGKRVSSSEEYDDQSGCKFLS